MTLAMFVRMFAFGLSLGVITGVASSSLESVRASQPELSAMAAAMLFRLDVYTTRHAHVA
jgi:hypothetical protein